MAACAWCGSQVAKSVAWEAPPVCLCGGCAPRFE